MTEAQLSPWLELAIFAIGLGIAEWKGREPERTTMALLAMVAMASHALQWLLATNYPVWGWAVLDFMAASILYFARSRVINPNNLGLYRWQAGVIALFGVMIGVHLAFYRGMLEADSIAYGRWTMVLTYLQMLIPTIASLAVGYESRLPRFHSLRRAGAWLLAPFEAGHKSVSRGHGR